MNRWRETTIPKWTRFFIWTAIAGALVAVFLFHPAWVDGLKKLVFLEYLPELKPGSGHVVLWLMGLLTSFHCIGMCGGIVLSRGICGSTGESGEALHHINVGSQETTGRNGWFLPSLLYNLGRVSSYCFIGGLAGGLGYLVRPSGAWKGIIPILAGGTMIIVGFNLFNWFPFLRKLSPRLPAGIVRRLTDNNRYSSFQIGLFSGLLPCGPLQAAQAYALSTGSVWDGAGAMLVFALGTVPLLLGLGAVHSFLNHRYTRQILKFSAVLVIVLGVQMFGRGLALAGFSLDLNLPVAEWQGVAQMRNGVQTVTTILEADQYQPILVQKGLPVHWRIEASAENLNDCNRSLFIPAYGIKQDLTAGANWIRFTPGKEGVVAYSCWMGMIQGRITVVADIKRYIRERHRREHDNK